MISFDTNVLFPAVDPSNPHHSRSLDFMGSLGEREDVLVSEFALVELYGLLRNPAVVAKPLSATESVGICQTIRNHPRWRIVGFGRESRSLHDHLWKKASIDSFPRRRIYDLRMALSLVEQGVTDFATVNTKDFVNAGFLKVWNPFSGQQ